MGGEEEEERKEKDPRDVIIPSSGSAVGQDVVDLTEGHQREENWSYLIALILGILFILVFVLVAHFVLRPGPIGPTTI